MAGGKVWVVPVMAIVADRRGRSCRQTPRMLIPVRRRTSRETARAANTVVRCCLDGVFRAVEDGPGNQVGLAHPERPLMSALNRRVALRPARPRGLPSLRQAMIAEAHRKDDRANADGGRVLSGRSLVAPPRSCGSEAGAPQWTVLGSSRAPQAEASSWIFGGVRRGQN